MITDFIVQIWLMILTFKMKDIGVVCSPISDCSAIGPLATIRLKLDDPKFKLNFSIYKQLKFDYKIWQSWSNNLDTLTMCIPIALNSNPYQNWDVLKTSFFKFGLNY
jgi:hypothetical protein